MNTHELAWAAGFFDGEGHIHARFGKRTKDPTRKVYQGLAFEVSQKDPTLLHRFRQAVGVGYILGPYKNDKNSQSSHYRFYTCKFEHVQHIVALMWNWLGSIKREQCKTALLKYVREPRLRPTLKQLGEIRRPECHPQSAYKANGLCNMCYRRSKRLQVRKGTVYP